MPVSIDPVAPPDAPPRPVSPSPWAVLGSPRATFSAVAAGASARPALRWLLWTLPLMPAAVAIGSHGAVTAALLENSELAGGVGRAWFVSAAAGILALLIQSAMLAVHLGLFVAIVRWLRTSASRREIVAVWAYAAFPLVLRQLLLVGVVAVRGVDWFNAHSSLIAFIDPFVLLVGVLFYVGCRQALRLSPRRAAVAAALASIVGVLGAVGGA